jgi:hypothetical protein
MILRCLGIFGSGNVNVASDASEVYTPTFTLAISEATTHLPVCSIAMPQDAEATKRRAGLPLHRPSATNRQNRGPCCLTRIAAKSVAEISSLRHPFPKP